MLPILDFTSRPGAAMPFGQWSRCLSLPPMQRLKKINYILLDRFFGMYILSVMNLFHKPLPI